MGSGVLMGWLVGKWSGDSSSALLKTVSTWKRVKVVNVKLMTILNNLNVNNKFS